MTRRNFAWLGAIVTAGAVLSVSMAACEDTNVGVGGFTFDAGPTPIIEGGPQPSDSGPIPIDPSIGLPPDAKVDLGLGDCGGVTTKSVDFTNVGGKPLDVTLATSAPFTIEPATLNVPPGGKGTVTLSVNVPAASVAGTPLTSTIVITTNDPKNPKLSVPVSVTPAGATLVFAQTPTSADFGFQKLGVKATDITLNLKNSGNKAATFTFGPPSDTQFMLATTPASPVALDPNAALTATVSFTPDKLTASTSVSNITVTGAVCGASTAKIDMTGQGSIGLVSGWPSTTVDFGSSTCGGAKASDKSFTLTNAGGQDVTITNVALGTKGYTASIAANAKIPKNGGTLNVTLTPPAVPFPSPIPGNYADTITITTDIPNDPPHVINVTVSAQGAILAFDTTATPNFGSFGQRPINSTASQSFAIKNTGNAAALVTASTTGAGFAVAPAGAVNVAASGGSAAFDATFHPTNTNPATGTLSIAATGLCQPLPPAKSLSGQGTQAGIAISDGSLAFQANCGTTAQAKSFTITNTGNAPLNWTGKLTAFVSPYTFSPPSGTIPAGAVATVTVSPKPIPQFPTSINPATYADFMTIKTDIPGDSDHYVFFSETPLGAVLSFSESSLAFGTLTANSSATLPLSITNSGNAGPGTTVTVSSSNPKFIVNTASGPASPGSPFNTSVTFQSGSAGGDFSSQITVSASAICSPLPQPISATGSTTKANVVASPSQSVIEFGTNGLVPCGGTGGPKDIQFTNPPPSSDYTVVSAVLGKGGASPFTVSILGGAGPNQNIVQGNNGTVVTVRATPIAIPPTVTTVPDFTRFSDTLTITTDAADDTPHVYQLVQGAEGVILTALATQDWGFGTVNYGATGFFKQSIQNAGNQDVQLTLTGIESPFAFTPINVPAGGSAEATASFTPPNPFGEYSATGQLAVPQGTVLCVQLPSSYAAVRLTGNGGDGAVYSVTGTLDFPPIACNSSANGPQSVVIHNDSNQTIDFSATLDVGTWYALDSTPFTGTIVSGGTATVTVTPSAIAGAGIVSGSNYTDQLDILLKNHATGAAITTYSVPITETAVGADITSYSYDDGFVTDGLDYCDYSSFNKNGYYADFGLWRFRNSGNATGTVSSTFTPNDGWSTASTTLFVSGTDFVPYVLRYNGTSPPNSCGCQTSAATLTFTGVCQNNVASRDGGFDYSILRCLDNCNFPNPPNQCF